MTATVVVRAPREDEVAAVVEVVNATSQGEFGIDDVDEAEVRRWFSQPRVDVERDVFVVEENGCLAAYADVGEDGEAGTQFWFDVRLPPQASEAAGEALIRACELRAAELATARRAAEPPRLIGGAWSVNERLLRLLERAGFRLYRHSLRMVIDLDEPPAEASLPEGLDVRSFQAGDERPVFAALDDAFRDSHDYVPGIYEEWRHWALDRDDFDPGLWWLVHDGDELAGFCLCRPHEAEADLGWVSSLGVRRAWRRRGIARALLLTSFHEFRRRGFARVGLGVDSNSLTGANLLYERAGMRAARRYDLFDKLLRS